jgi:formamidopyrimidine-DNA glycosylase
MPELPEVETTRLGIEPHIADKRVKQLIVRNPALRWPVPADMGTWLDGSLLRAVERRGKYLLFRFEQGTAIWHLGMSGAIRIMLPGKVPDPMVHDHVDVIFADGTCLRYTDPRRFGCLLWTTDDPNSHALIGHLGPEPLSDAFDGDYLFQQTRKRKQNIKTLIMDAKVVVGVGNIYANEALFSAGIRPGKAAGRVTRAAAAALCKEIKRILARSIKQGGTTLRDFTGGDGKPGYFAQQLNVYGRAGKPCRQCAQPLKEVRMANRTTVYCSSCQR